VSPAPDLSALTSAQKDALVTTLLARLEAMEGRIAGLEKENAVLRAQLKLPPKTPDNSSKPPSQGHKASG